MDPVLILFAAGIGLAILNFLNVFLVAYEKRNAAKTESASKTENATLFLWLHGRITPSSAWSASEPRKSSIFWPVMCVAFVLASTSALKEVATYKKALLEKTEKERAKVDSLNEKAQAKIDAINKEQVDRAWRDKIEALLGQVRDSKTPEDRNKALRDANEQLKSGPPTVLHIESQTGAVTPRVRRLLNGLQKSEFKPDTEGRGSNFRSSEPVIFFEPNDAERAGVLKAAMEGMHIDHVKLSPSLTTKGIMRCFLPSRGWTYAGKFRDSTHQWDANDKYLRIGDALPEVNQTYELIVGHPVSQSATPMPGRIDGNIPPGSITVLDVLEVPLKNGDKAIWVEFL